MLTSFSYKPWICATWATYNWLEKEFSKLQESGGTYFINVQQCIEKLHIKKTSLLLNQNVNIDAFYINVHLVIINFVRKI